MGRWANTERAVQSILLQSFAFDENHVSVMLNGQNVSKCGLRVLHMGCIIMRLKRHENWPF